MEVEKTLELLVTAVTNMNDNMNMRFDRLEGRMDKLETRMDKLESDVAELKTDVAVLKTDVAELKTDVAELKTDVAVLKTDVRDLKLANENQILPAIKIMGENWPGLVQEVHTIREKVDQLAEVQDVHSTAIQEQATNLQLLRAKTK